MLDHYVAYQPRPIAGAVLRFVGGPAVDELVGPRRQRSLFP